MSAPAEATHHMAGITFRRSEGCINRRATHCVVYEVKSLTARVAVNIFFRLLTRGNLSALAPNLTATSRLSSETVANTFAPIAFAICTARCPTPPAPAWIRTVCPSCTLARSMRPSHAVIAARGSAADSRGERHFGRIARRSSFTEMYSARRTLQPAPHRRPCRKLHLPDETGRPSSNLLHNTGHIHSENGRQRLFRMGCLACANLRIERVDAARLDTHQNLVGSRCGARPLTLNEFPSGLFHNVRFHRCAALIQ